MISISQPKPFLSTFACDGVAVSRMTSRSSRKPRMRSSLTRCRESGRSDGGLQSQRRNFIETGVQMEGRAPSSSSVAEISSIDTEMEIISPTVFRDMPPKCTIAHEEIFGLVFGLMLANDLNETIGYPTPASSVMRRISLPKVVSMVRRTIPKQRPGTSVRTY